VTAEHQLVALVRAARESDDAAWRELVGRFDPPLRRVARSYGLTSADVDDVLQTTWIRLFRHIGRIREPAAIGAWLTTTVRRESMQLLQRQVREVLVDDPVLGDSPQPDGPEAAVLAAELRTTLVRAFADLPRRHERLMLLLVSEDAPDYYRVSAVLGMPRGSIGPTRARCLARLQQSTELRRLVGPMNPDPIHVSS
jgi:RNA polymerase sigma factor (sigma-70 family)